MMTDFRCYPIRDLCLRKRKTRVLASGFGALVEVLKALETLRPHCESDLANHLMLRH
jgi:hypothetical protein